MQESEWTWSDGSQLVYTGDIGGRIDESQDACVSLKLNDNHWREEDCATRHAFICGIGLIN